MIRHGVAEGTAQEDREAVERFMQIERMEEGTARHEQMAVANPDDYRSWGVLKRSICGRKAGWEEHSRQLELAQNAIEVNPKSYYPWHHRLFVFGLLRGAGTDAKKLERLLAREKALCNVLLQMDPRNFHCWNYCLRMRLPMALDYSNSSSVNFSLSRHLYAAEETAGPGITLESALRFVYTDPNDETAWRCLQRVVAGARKAPFYMRVYASAVEMIATAPLNRRIALPAHAIVQRSEAEIVLDAASIESALPCDVRGDENGHLVLERERCAAVYAAVDEILRMLPDCIFALKHRLQTTADRAERSGLIARLIELDPLRRAFYSSRMERYSEIYTIK
ncbi:geranylgeranyl transferase type-2 subunit alpha [Pancytospora philotis]|nr:geranylgeranyl transferase type-2 subunit alpha [Pancytospora philotis]